MIPYKVIALTVYSLFVLFWLAIFGRAGLEGLFRRKVRFHGLGSIQFFKVNQVEGNAALIYGRILIAISFMCVLSWLIIVAQEFASR